MNSRNEDLSQLESNFSRLSFCRHDTRALCRRKEKSVGPIVESWTPPSPSNPITNKRRIQILRHSSRSTDLKEEKPTAAQNDGLFCEESRKEKADSVKSFINKQSIKIKKRVTISYLEEGNKEDHETPRKPENPVNSSMHQMENINKHPVRSFPNAPTLKPDVLNEINRPPVTAHSYFPKNRGRRSNYYGGPFARNIWPPGNRSMRFPCRWKPQMSLEEYVSRSQVRAMHPSSLLVQPYTFHPHFNVPITNRNQSILILPSRTWTREVIPLPNFNYIAHLKNMGSPNVHYVVVSPSVPTESLPNRWLSANMKYLVPTDFFVGCPLYKNL